MPVDFEQIRVLRTKRQLTQQEAAERAGWKGPNAKMRWSDLEKGRYPDPQLSTLEAACRALDCDLLDIILLEQPRAAAKPGASAPGPPRGQKRKRPSGAAGSNG